MKSRARGLSLLEVLVSMSVLAIAILGVLAALTRVMVAQSSTSHQTMGRIVADSVISQAALAGVAGNWGRDPDPSQQVRQVRVGQSAELVDYHFEITPLEIVGAGLNPAVGPQMGRLYQLQVRVWWNAGNNAVGAIERGEESITVIRDVYLET